MLFLFKGVAGGNGTGTTVKQYENKTYPISQHTSTRTAQLKTQGVTSETQ